MNVVSIKIDKKQIGYLKWILESHDGMATPTTRQGHSDIVDLLVVSDFEDEMNELLDALKNEFSILHVDPPEQFPLIKN